ncbi:Hexokinase-1 [Colletotrichum sp. SAR 10_70]|nr:Hexokinase-1 [Colletotrichum sp. SAR 10_71]KAI8157378.1 Hexokinase-1 [Colletotrichum sp. SAR 10_70]KAI8174608.1 Hexokinase-1 [Colletotrichum sp. SAR 10_75]KAI8199958.1 Hexokinase-1 [Colletotrichum sp. SAR 10_76]KAI8218588.1 Hexokinase-1 [Colletotrichum sp. SAR 10_77]KAJ5001633.1 Hexokinase-1 [Colletotrichum sp. SAR 10_66]
MDPGSALQDFLQPLRVDNQTVHTLSRLFYSNFKDLALNAHDQFLPTPISESILRPVTQRGRGRHLAIDIGGTNLRVGFIELSGAETPSTTANSTPQTNGTSSTPTLRLKEQAWPIDNALKASSNSEPQLLFDWIGSCIATVVRSALEEWPSLAAEPELPLGITFSFPMVQHSISDATVMTMGKGFSIQGDAELGPLLLRGYDKARSAAVDVQLPPIRIAAISNDSVSTLISFIFLSPPTTKASMGLIVGTGCNATIPLKLSLLGGSKQPANISLLPGESASDVRIAVNTEWSIRGTAPPLRELKLITTWDSALDAALVGPNEITGFQPLEYMTAGRYLGELGRLMLLDYLKTVLGVNEDTLPSRLLVRYGLTTTFLSHFKPLHSPALLPKLESEFPADAPSPFKWTEEMATALYHIAKAIELRAAGIVSAATVALLRLAGDLPSDGTPSKVPELGVGYTGGCISQFQDYLADTQMFLDEIMKLDYDGKLPTRVVLSPCHDGGIKGAGILAAATCVSQKHDM